MKKILIIGSCGSGKSTFAKALSKKLNLPLIGLDQCYWKHGWVRPEREEWRKRVSELVKGENWIMEGNYQSTFDIRFPASDTIIVLNINRFICFWRIWTRRKKQINGFLSQYSDKDIIIIRKSKDLKRFMSNF